jgi:transcriptional regulator with XRE-family HTH domain
MPKAPAIAAAFAARLNAIIEAKGLNQSQLSRQMYGRSPRDGKALGRDRLSVWTRGKSLPSPESLALLAKALDVETTDLMPKAEVDELSRLAPSASMVVYPDGRALVSINQVFPLETAIAIMKLVGTKP